MLLLLSRGREPSHGEPPRGAGPWGVQAQDHRQGRQAEAGTAGASGSMQPVSLEAGLHLGDTSTAWTPGPRGAPREHAAHGRPSINLAAGPYLFLRMELPELPGITQERGCRAHLTDLREKLVPKRRGELSAPPDSWTTCSTCGTVLPRRLTGTVSVGLGGLHGSAPWLATPAAERPPRNPGLRTQGACVTLRSNLYTRGNRDPKRQAPRHVVRSARFSAGVGRGLPCPPRAAEAPCMDAHSASPGDGHGHCARSFSGKESGCRELCSLCVAGFPFPGGTLTPQGPEKELHLPWAPPASRLRARPHPSQVSAGRWAQGLPRTHACVCSCRAPRPDVGLHRRPHRTTLVTALLVASCPKRGNKNCGQQVTNLQGPSGLVIHGL